MNEHSTTMEVDITDFGKKVLADFAKNIIKSKIPGKDYWEEFNPNIDVNIYIGEDKNWHADYYAIKDGSTDTQNPISLF
jgi:hypothetical protein